MLHVLTYPLSQNKVCNCAANFGVGTRGIYDRDPAIRPKSDIPHQPLFGNAEDIQSENCAEL